MIAPPRILLADDDPKVASVVAEALELEGLAVDHVLDGEQVVERALGGGYSLVVLDWMLPLRPGIDCCRTIRQASSVPILMLTARSHESDVVRAIEVGADDYVTKPFSIAEVAVRVRALLRRRELDCAELRAAQQPSVVHAGPIEIDLRRREATCNGRLIALTKTELDLLALLASRAGEVLGREEIMRHLWRTDTVGDTRSCDFHVRNLRRKLGDDCSQPSLIVAVRGGGYRLEA